MPRQIRRIVLAALFVVAFPVFLGLRASASSAASPAGTIVGTVRDNDGRPIPFARLVLLEMPCEAMSDRIGRFRIADVPPGTYRLRASHLYFSPVEMTVNVHWGEEVIANLTFPQGGWRYFASPEEEAALRQQLAALRAALQSQPETLRAVQDAFAARLHQELASAGGNLVHSPLCVAGACGLLLRGARGETAREIADMLDVDPDATSLLGAIDTLRAFLSVGATEQGDQWAMANGAWFDSSVQLRQDFLESVASASADTIGTLDFDEAPDQSRAHINNWICGHTRGRIPDLLDPGSIDPLTVLVLANALYLHARWLNAFSKRETADLPFWVAGVDSADVPTMRTMRKVPYGSTEEAQVVRLDYRGGHIGMVIVLPHERDGLDGLERSLDARRIAELRASLAPALVELHLPRCKIESRWDLTPSLRRMGVSKAFIVGECDLSHAIGDAASRHDIRVSRAVHVATIDVDEEGTEAAAAAALVITRGDSGARHRSEEPLPLHVDHPFLWWIQENTTGTILFMGRVVDP